MVCCPPPRRPPRGCSGFQYVCGWTLVGNFNYRLLQANLSLRVDKHELLRAEQTISPRGALVFRVAPRTSLRMSGGTAFRAMNGLESYVNLQLNTAADGYFVEFFGAATDPRGQTLGPERIANAEIGVRDESSAVHSLDVVAYWNQVTRLIDIGSVEPVLRGFQEDGEGWPFGRAGWVNTPTIYDAVGVEVDLTLFPTDGLDVFGNVSVSRVFGRDPTASEAFVDNSNGLVKANVGVQYRTPWRLDLSLATHFTSGQVWRVPEFDDRGGVVVNLRPIPARALVVTRIVGHVVDDPGLELGLTLWNPVGFAGGFREHPNGQLVGPRIYGHLGVRF